MFEKINRIVRVLEEMLHNEVAHKEISRYVTDNFTQLQLETLNIEIAKCESCEASGFATLGEGPVKAKIVFVLYKKTDAVMSLLTKVIKAAQTKISPLWDLKDIYVTYLIKCPEQSVTHRTIASCKNYVEQEIKLVNPTYVVCFGEDVANVLIHPKVDMQTEQFKEFGSSIHKGSLITTRGLGDLDKVSKENRVAYKKDIIHTLRVITELQQGA